MRTPPPLPSVEHVIRELDNIKILEDHPLKRGVFVKVGTDDLFSYAYKHFNGMIGQVVCTYNYCKRTITWVQWFHATIPRELLTIDARKQLDDDKKRCNILTSELVLVEEVKDNHSALGFLNGSEAF